MNILVISICVGLIGVVAACVIIAHARRRILAPVRVERLSLSDVVKFFKQEKIVSKLAANEGDIAVALKEKSIGDWTRIALCVYNKQKSSVSEPLGLFDVKELDESLVTVFGDKDMLVLK